MTRKPIRLTSLSPRGTAVKDDVVAVEAPVVLAVNGTPVVSLFCTPEDLQALAVGFLYAVGILRNRDDVAEAEIEVMPAAVSVKMNRPWIPGKDLVGIGSGCGGNLIIGPTGLVAPLPAEGGEIEAEGILSLNKDFQARAVLYRETGGTHCAAVCRPEGILFFAEDTGRHNAADKVIGHALLAGTSLEDKALFLSGRIAYDIAMKAARARIPLCVSRSAPTSAALAFGERIGLTIIGFVRGRRMNIYTHPERVIL